jgi:hypothetical protein
MILVEITLMCQYIVTVTIFYFLNRQGGSVSRMNVQTVKIFNFWKVHIALSIILSRWKTLYALCWTTPNLPTVVSCYSVVWGGAESFGDDLSMPTTFSQVQSFGGLLPLFLYIYFSITITTFIQSFTHNIRWGPSPFSQIHFDGQYLQNHCIDFFFSMDSTYNTTYDFFISMDST